MHEAAGDEGGANFWVIGGADGAVELSDKPVGEVAEAAAGVEEDGDWEVACAQRSAAILRIEGHAC